MKSDEVGVAPEVLTGQQQGVPQLQVVDDGDRGTQVRVGHPSPPHQADLPAAAPGPQAEIGLLAVAEIALVEQADVLEAGPAGEQQGAMGVVDRLPALRHRPPAEEGAEVAVHHRAETVTDVGTGEAGPGPWRDGGYQALEAVRGREGVVGADADPLPRTRGQPVAQPDVGPRAEPEVVPGREELVVRALGHHRSDDLPGGGLGAGVDHDDPGGHGLGPERGDGRPAALRAVAMDDDDRQRRHERRTLSTATPQPPARAMA